MKDKIFLALMEASAAHGMKSRVGFQKMDLSEGQPKVLYILAQNPGCVQKELAEKCGVSQPTLTAILERMIQKELVCREKTITSAGKRSFRVYLTPHGSEIADGVNQWVEELECLSLKGFSEEERRQLLSLLGRVSDNLKNS